MLWILEIIEIFKFPNKNYEYSNIALTLVNTGGVGESSTEHPLDPRAVCKLEFVRCGPDGEKQSGLEKFESHLFPNTKIEIFGDFFPIFNKIPEFSKDSQGTTLENRDLLFWILALYIHM